MAETQPKQNSYGRAQMSDNFVKKIWAQLDQFRKDEAARKEMEQRIRRYEERRRRNERDKRREERLEMQKRMYDDERGHHHHRTASSHRMLSPRASHLVHSTSGQAAHRSDRNAGSGRRHEHRNQNSSATEERGKRNEDRHLHHRRRSRSPFRSVTCHSSPSHSSRNKASHRSGRQKLSRSKHHDSNRDSRNRRHHQYRTRCPAHGTNSRHVHHSGHSSSNRITHRNHKAAHSRSPHRKNSDQSNQAEEDHEELPVRRRRGFDHPPRFTRRRIPPPGLIPLPLLSSKNRNPPHKEQDENEDTSNDGDAKKPFSFDINMDTRRVRLTYGQALFCELNENEEDPNKYYNINWM